MSLSLKDSIAHWNKRTNVWLRSVVYERGGRNKVYYTYALSALWHGFYPGYYLTFASGALFTIAGRSVSILRLILPFRRDFFLTRSLPILTSHARFTDSLSPSTVVPGVSTKENILRHINVYRHEDYNGLHNVQFCTIRIYAKHQSVPVSQIFNISRIIL